MAENKVTSPEVLFKVTPVPLDVVWVTELFVVYTILDETKFPVTTTLPVIDKLLSNNNPFKLFYNFYYEDKPYQKFNAKK